MRAGMVALGKVVRMPRNAKGHDLGAIHRSYDRFAFLERVVINEETGHLISGHGRVDALQQRKAAGAGPPGNVEVGNGGEWLVPADWVSVAAEDEEAAAVALNRLVESGGWDELRLGEVLAELAAADKLDGTGYDGDDVDAILGDLARAVGVSEQGSAVESVVPDASAASSEFRYEVWGPRDAADVVGEFLDAQRDIGVRWALQVKMPSRLRDVVA